MSSPPSLTGTMKERPGTSGGSGIGGVTINIGKEDPEKLFQLMELVGTGSYGEVFKVYAH